MISGGYLGDTFLGYLFDIWGKSGDIWGRVGEYLEHIWGISGGCRGISEVYLGNIWRMYFGGQIGDILGISCTSLIVEYVVLYLCIYVFVYLYFCICVFDTCEYNF